MQIVMLPLSFHAISANPNIFFTMKDKTFEYNQIFSICIPTGRQNMAAYANRIVKARNNWNNELK